MTAFAVSEKFPVFESTTLKRVWAIHGRYPCFGMNLEFLIIMKPVVYKSSYSVVSKLTYAFRFSSSKRNIANLFLFWKSGILNIWVDWSLQWRPQMKLIMVIANRSTELAANNLCLRFQTVSLKDRRKIFKVWNCLINYVKHKSDCHV